LQLDVTVDEGDLGVVRMRAHQRRQLVRRLFDALLVQQLIRVQRRRRLLRLGRDRVKRDKTADPSRSSRLGHRASSS
jgi:hypothetical protein